MTESEAKTHDFARELHEARLRAFQAAVAKDPEDQPALLGLAKEAHALKNAAAAEAAYQALLASGPPHRVSLNEKAWWYAEDGGTNLDRAYELALKAQAEDPRSEEIVDTVGWVLFKRGDYEQALRVMRSISKSYVDGVPDIQFHFGMALYMQMEEEAARAAFQKFSKNRIQKYLRQKYGSPDGKVRIGSNVLLAYTLDEAEEAEKCLGILEIKRGTRRPELLAKLRARLTTRSLGLTTHS